MNLNKKLKNIEKEFNISNITTVSKLNNFIEQKLSDKKLSNIYLIGEVSDFRKYSSGHAYFNLKDEDSLINCILFKDTLKNIKYVPEEGKEVLVLASVTVYKKRGRYQLTIIQSFPIGEGLLNAKFKKLKEKLQKQGLFDKEHKKEIPLLPRTIGIATSKEGSVIKDILDILKSRFPNVNVILSPTTVQGELAPESIINSIKLLNKIEEIDTIILGRGGGSLEDLDCFNNEEVAKEIFNSKKPIISAIGHEDNLTITDLVSDKKAITPPHAAEIVIIDKKEEKEKLRNFKIRLENLRDYYKTKTKAKEYKNIIIIIVVIFILYLLWRLLK